MSEYFKLFYINNFKKFENYLNRTLVELPGIEKNALIKRICQAYNNKCEYSYNLNSAILSKEINYKLLKKNKFFLHISCSKINTKTGEIYLKKFFFLKEYLKFFVRILKINFFILLSLFIYKKISKPYVFVFSDSKSVKLRINELKKKQLKKYLNNTKLAFFKKDYDVTSLIYSNLRFFDKFEIFFINFYNLFKFSFLIIKYPFLVILNKDLPLIETFNFLKKKNKIHSIFFDISNISEQFLWQHGLKNSFKTFFLWESDTPFIDLQFKNFKKYNLRYINYFIRADNHLVKNNFQMQKLKKFECTNLFNSKIIKIKKINFLKKKNISKNFKIGIFPTGIATTNSLKISGIQVDNLYSYENQKKFVFDIVNSINKINSNLTNDILAIIKPRHSINVSNYENSKFYKYLEELKIKFPFIIIDKETNFINTLKKVNLSITMPFTSVPFSEIDIFNKRGIYYDPTNIIVDKAMNNSKKYFFVQNKKKLFYMISRYIDE